MTAPLQLTRAGKFVTQRDLIGAAAADSATLTEANFPLAAAVSGFRAATVWIYWDGTGGGAADTIVVQILIRDAINSFWVATVKKTLTRREAQEFSVQSASEIFVRIDSVAGTTATALKVRVARAQADQVE